MNGLTASEKMGLGPEVRELKFGESFNNNPRAGNGFHTIRYDFKPASVDSTKMATLDVQSGQVTIAVPHSDGASVNMFSGPRKPYAKECVLIIDPDTGECVLEKLTNSINVKKTRQEGGGRISKHSITSAQSGPPGPPPPTLLPNPPTKRPPSSGHHRKDPKIVQEPKQQLHDKLSNTTGKSSSMQRRPQSPNLARNSPISNNTSPPNPSPTNGSNAFDTLLSNHKQKHHQQQQQQQASTMPSLTDFDDLLATAASVSPTPPVPVAPTAQQSFKSKGSSSTSHSSRPSTKSLTSSGAGPAPVVQSALSESSSSSSSSGSSSESEDDDDESSDDDDMEVVPERILSMPSMPSMPTDLFSNGPLSQPSSRLPPPPPPPMTSNILSEDLQLSESGSDSD